MADTPVLPAHVAAVAPSSAPANTATSSSPADKITTTNALLGGAGTNPPGVESLYPSDEPWKHGLEVLSENVLPFMKRFVQQADGTSADALAEAALPSQVDWTGFARMLRDVRRTIHRYPEIGFQEVRTQAFVRRFCENALQIPAANVRTLATTGLVVDVCYQNAAVAPSDTRTLPVLAFRADLDALPIEEISTHLPYCSNYRKTAADGSGATTTGPAAHMCGHDGHTTMVLGLLALVVRQSHLLPPDTFVRFMFQPAEEGPGGAELMIQEGVLQDVDEVYGLHNAPFPLYSVHVRSGPVLSHQVEFWIDITGVGGHGSAPQDCVDPILAGAHVVTALQSIVSRSLSPLDSAVVSVTQFHGGDANNVIPNTVRMAGTIRDFDEAVTEKIKSRMEQIAQSTCLAFGASATVKFKDGYPPVLNPLQQTQLVEHIARETGLSVSDEGLPLMASEDFSYYLQQRKGCFFFLGTKENGDVAKTRALHSNAFDFNDKATPLGIRVFLGVLQSRLQCQLLKTEELLAFQTAMEQIVG